MLTIKDPSLQRLIREGNATVEMVSAYIMNNYPIKDIVDSLAEKYITEVAKQPIVITEEQLAQHFRIVGQRVTEDGEIIKETRGRKRKDA